MNLEVEVDYPKLRECASKSKYYVRRRSHRKILQVNLITVTHGGGKKRQCRPISRTERAALTKPDAYLLMTSSTTMKSSYLKFDMSVPRIYTFTFNWTS